MLAAGQGHYPSATNKESEFIGLSILRLLPRGFILHLRILRKTEALPTMSPNNLTLIQFPIWFQAIKGATATKSGLMNLPMILCVVICSMLAGALVTLTGYYTPFMITSSIIVSIGAGLLTTLIPTSPHEKWIGYQALFGIGLGMGLQQPLIVIQTALPETDVPSATAVIMFAQTLGGAVFVSVAQNVFQNGLVRNLSHQTTGVDVQKIMQAGATSVRGIVEQGSLGKVLEAYNGAVTEAFYVGVAMSVFSVLGTGVVEWLSVKGKKSG